jgi:NitT/TauT family transport system ATP-binding protein
MSARPAHIRTERAVDLPRPRDLEVCYEPGFVDIVHDLRTQISEARQ